MNNIKAFKSRHKNEKLNSSDFEKLYNIGIDYKTSLSIKEKNSFTWKDLASFLNITWMTGEQYRLWVVNMQRKNGTLSIRNDDNKLVKPEDTSEETLLSSINPDVYKERTKMRDIVNNYRKALRDDARIESLKELIIKTVDVMKSLPDIYYDGKYSKSSAEAILVLSDWHLGVDINNALNKFNLEIARKRLNKVVTKTINFCRLHNVSRLSILNIGDLTAGHIHPTIRINQNEDAISQIMIAAELMAKTVNQLKAAASEVVYRSTTDNHMRLEADKNSNIEIENFNRIVDWYVESRVSGVKFPHDNMAPSICAFKLKNGKRVAAAHGHLDNPNQAFQHFIGMTQEWIDFVILGHQHTGKEKDFNGMTVIVNGCLCGVDDYAFDKRLVSKPMQKLVIFDGDEDFINCSITVGDIKE